MKFLVGLAFLLPTSPALVSTSHISVEAAPDPTISDVWMGPDGQPLPFRSHREAVEFLNTARIVSVRSIGKGTSDTKKVVLEEGSLRAAAAFRTIRKRMKRVRIGGRFHLNFRDDHIYEAAAYHLARMLGLKSIPATVTRKIGGRSGTLQLWVEDAVSESERRRRGAKPPDILVWSRQVQVKKLFDRLINNEDRNLGNQLIDRRWKLWLIDHTRSFHPTRHLRTPQAVYWCPTSLWEKLTSLDRGEVARRLDPYLRDVEIESLFDRWEAMIDHLRALSRKRGPKSVFF